VLAAPEILTRLPNVEIVEGLATVPGAPATGGSAASAAPHEETTE
jgi:hypothetical protein